MTAGWVALVESNTTGTGRIFARRVRELGLRPLLLCADPARYGYLEADGVDHVVTDTGSPAAVAAAVREVTGDGCRGITTSSERAVLVTARAAALLGLPGESADAVERCRDKGEQRRAMAAAGLRTPAYRVCASPAQAAAAAAEIGLPVVVKPVTGTGSAGVRSCRTTAEAGSWAERLLAPAGAPMVLVEQQLAGAEFSVETVGTHVLGVTATLLGPEPHFVETGHDFPAALPAETAGLIAGEALRALSALGAGAVAAHTELRYGPDGPVVVEVNPRPAGGMIPQLVLLASGVDPITAVLEVVTGGTPKVTPTLRRHAAIRFVIPGRDGIVRAIDGVADARGLPGVAEVSVAPRTGTAYERRNSFEDRIGYVIATGTSAVSAGALAERALRRIRVSVQEENQTGQDKGSVPS
ncbi:ATP-grasp domain-containing protein [Amycolatopsis sp. NPDC059021]|uniref:ATP-grasp domain-containing protein n=1 Tax=Amycolatopsis sp. NPDC059021 TaxID=3346704 RepID=UPI0036719EDF